MQYCQQYPELIKYGTLWKRCAPYCPHFAVLLCFCYIILLYLLYLRKSFILENAHIHFLAESWMRGLSPLICTSIKYKATTRKSLAKLCIKIWTVCQVLSEGVKVSNLTRVISRLSNLHKNQCEKCKTKMSWFSGLLSERVRLVVSSI